MRKRTQNRVCKQVKRACSLIMGDTKTGNEKAAFPTDAIIEAPL